MAFFTLIVPTDPALRPKEKEIECGLRLFVNQATGEYDYKFSNLTFLLENPGDTLVFFIKNEIPNTKAHFIRHMYSGPEKSSIGVNKKMFVTHVNGKTPNQSDPYDVEPTRATYKFELDDYEMINIGLVVDIMDLGTSRQRIKRMLCDPQVGNGPP